MKVIREETSGGELIRLTFRRNGENLSEFKAAVKNWVEDTFPGWDEKEIYEKMTILDANRIVLENLI